MMIINRSIDIEEEVRKTLADYKTAYCRPLPEGFAVPCILVQQVGGTDIDTIDTFEVVLDARAELEADALELLNDAVGILKAVAAMQTTAMRHVAVNSRASWGVDPVRPELAMCSARLQIIAHEEQKEVTKWQHTT